MISRRSTRIKAMQALYMREKDTTIAPQQLFAHVEKQLDSYHRLYMLNLYLLAETANYVNEAAQLSASKLLKTNDEAEFSVRLFHNPLVQNIVLSPAYQESVRKEKFDLVVSRDLFRKLYGAFAETPYYKNYTENQDHSVVIDFRALTRLYGQVIAADETVESTLEDLIPSWHDDKQAITMWVNQTLRHIADNPEATVIEQRNPVAEREVKQFARSLVEAFVHHDVEYSELIKPRLQNWDEDRIAEIDMLLIKMGITEFLYLEDIPVKVTINEYLEIAKLYSTPQSKDFINGILDGVLKNLREQNKLRKTGRGMVE